MARGHLTFRQSDVTRALRAAGKAGITVNRVEIDRDGKIIMLTGKSTEAEAVNEWGEVPHRDSH
jgi:hypothetical protein